MIGSQITTYALGYREVRATYDAAREAAGETFDFEGLPRRDDGDGTGARQPLPRTVRGRSLRRGRVALIPGVSTAQRRGGT